MRGALTRGGVLARGAGCAPLAQRRCGALRRRRWGWAGSLGVKDPWIGARGAARRPGGRGRAGVYPLSHLRHSPLGGGTLSLLCWCSGSIPALHRCCFCVVCPGEWILGAWHRSRPLGWPATKDKARGELQPTFCHASASSARTCSGSIPALCRCRLCVLFGQPGGLMPFTIDRGLVDIR